MPNDNVWRLIKSDLAIFDTPTGGRVAGWLAGWPGGWPGGPVGNCDYIANSAQLKLELGLSLAKFPLTLMGFRQCCYVTEQN